MVGRIAEKWHFCYTIHKTLHLSLFWSDGGNDDGVLPLVVLLLLFASQSDSSVSQSDKQKQVSLFVMIHVLFLVHERNTHALCINFHASQKISREREYNPLVSFISLLSTPHFLIKKSKAKHSNLETLRNSLFLNIKKKSPYSTASGAKPAGPGIHKHTTHDTHRHL